MPFWWTIIYLPYDKIFVTIKEITFYHGIFQGESLSILLLFLALLPLTHMIKRAGVGYRLHNKIFHTYYM